MQPVAIIGAGPGGIAAARWLKAEGFAPQIFESHSAPGGQWDHTNPNSGVWPDMVTNTFLEATRFGDKPYPPGTPIFPHNRDVLRYMRDYAGAFGVLEGARYGWRLSELSRTKDGYALTFDTEGGPQTVSFARVVIATGRFNRPTIPPIPGDESFSG
ncbi:MAG: FAD-dependent oxidoreductase, partial [Pseudomonadota bacterium]